MAVAPLATARADDGYLAIERHPFLVDERHLAEILPPAVGVLGGALTLTCPLPSYPMRRVLRTPGTPSSRSARSSCDRASRPPASASSEFRAARRAASRTRGPARWPAPRSADRCARREPIAACVAQRLDGDVLPVEGQHLAFARQPAKELRVGEWTVQQPARPAPRAHRGQGRETGNRGRADSRPMRASGRAGRLPRCLRS